MKTSVRRQSPCNQTKFEPFSKKVGRIFGLWLKKNNKMWSFKHADLQRTKIFYSPSLLLTAKNIYLHRYV